MTHYSRTTAGVPAHFFARFLCALVHWLHATRGVQHIFARFLFLLEVSRVSTRSLQSGDDGKKQIAKRQVRYENKRQKRQKKRRRREKSQRQRKGKSQRQRKGEHEKTKNEVRCATVNTHFSARKRKNFCQNDRRTNSLPRKTGVPDDFLKEKGKISPLPRNISR